MTIEVPLFWWGAVGSIIESQRGSGELEYKARLRRLTVRFSVTGDLAAVERIAGCLEAQCRLWALEG